jgi:hypothetical protein
MPLEKPTSETELLRFEKPPSGEVPDFLDNCGLLDSSSPRSRDVDGFAYGFVYGWV